MIQSLCCIVTPYFEKIIFQCSAIFLTAFYVLFYFSSGTSGSIQTFTENTFNSSENFWHCLHGCFWLHPQWSDKSRVCRDPSPSAGWQIWHATGSPFSLIVIWTPRSFLSYTWHASARFNMTELLCLSLQSTISPDNDIRQWNLLKFEPIPSVRRLR